jgi:Putative phage abortive infection protein
MSDSKNIKTEKERFRWWLIGGVVGIVLAFIFMPWMLTWTSPACLVSFMNTGQVGDTIGGIMGPIVGAIGAILTFVAFREQYLANQRQWEVINEQKEDAEMDRFRNQFFELLKMLREDTNNIKIKTQSGELNGNEAIKAMVLELRVISDDFDRKIEKQKGLGKISKEAKIDRLRQCHVFYGVLYRGKSYKDEIKTASVEESNETSTVFLGADLLKQFIADLNFKSLLEENKIIKPGGMVDSVSFSLPSDYVLAIGHRPYLSGYFRLLFRIAEFHFNFTKTRIEKEKEGKNSLTATKISRSTEELDSLGKLLRTQLSDEAQILLYFNCMMDFGKEWWERGYLQKYALLKNAAWHMLPKEIHPENVVEFMGPEFGEKPSEAMKKARDL